MSTLEDVFYLFERNSRYYYTCKKCHDYECNCYEKPDILPFTIGDQTASCDLKVKCYIKPGDECPICYDPIMTKSSAFITDCGHSFHKKCLFKSMETKWLSTAYSSNARCPMCRNSLGHPEFIQRYRSSYFSYKYKNDNKLDQLEDLWLSIDYKLPNFCSNKYDHYLGLSKACQICKSYREKGELLYEIN
jgi:hypothetical protein